MFHKILRMLYLICIDISLLNNNRGHREVEVERQRQVEINQIIEEWRNEDADALNYEGQQNRGDNSDLNVNRNM